MVKISTDKKFEIFLKLRSQDNLSTDDINECISIIKKNNISKSEVEWLSKHNIYDNELTKERSSGNIETSFPETKILYNYFPEKYRRLSKTSSTDLIKEINQESQENNNIAEVLSKVLTGGNIRDTTEMVTKNRLGLSENAALSLFHKVFSNDQALTIRDFLRTAEFELVTNTKASDAFLFSLWHIGLTRKGWENIIRNDYSYLFSYINLLEEIISKYSEESEKEIGELTGELKLGDKSIELSWDFFALLFIFISSQSLTIRGSDKSRNGKFFEKIILGSLFTVLGFSYKKTMPVNPDKKDKIFILSSQDEENRESDAQLFYNNKYVSVDIGFIGGGNPEITLDKLTRFNNLKDDRPMVPLVIVDTISGTQISSRASNLSGCAVEMKDPNWTREVARFLQNYFGCSFELSNLNNDEIDEYLRNKISNIDLSQFT